MNIRIEEFLSKRMSLSNPGHPLFLQLNLLGSKWWQNDPSNPECVANPYGTSNCLISVGKVRVRNSPQGAGVEWGTEKGEP
jgi:hypothetical protein